MQSVVKILPVLCAFVVNLVAAELGPPPEPVYLSNVKVAALWQWAQSAHTELILAREKISDLESQISDAPSPDPTTFPEPRFSYVIHHWNGSAYAPSDDPFFFSSGYVEKRYDNITEAQFKELGGADRYINELAPYSGEPEQPPPDPDPEISNPISQIPTAIAGGFRVTFPARAPGSYIIEATTLAPNQQSDSFWITINGGARVQWNIPIAPDWQANTIAPNGTPLLVDGAAVTIDFAQREPAQLQLVTLRRVESTTNN